MTGEVTDRALNEFYPDPQNREQHIIGICDNCGNPIYEGYDYKEKDDVMYCHKCHVPEDEEGEADEDLA